MTQESTTKESTTQESTLPELKVSDFIGYKNVLPLHRNVIGALGNDHLLAAVIEHLEYLRPVHADSEGWVTRTRDELAEDAAATKWQLRSARQRGQALGVLETRTVRVQDDLIETQILQWRVNQETFLGLLKNFIAARDATKLAQRNQAKTNWMRRLVIPNPVPVEQVVSSSPESEHEEIGRQDIAGHEPGHGANLQHGGMVQIHTMPYEEACCKSATSILYTNLLTTQTQQQNAHENLNLNQSEINQHKTPQQKTPHRKTHSQLLNNLRDAGQITQREIHMFWQAQNRNRQTGGNVAIILEAGAYPEFSQLCNRARGDVGTFAKVLLEKHRLDSLKSKLTALLLETRANTPMAELLTRLDHLSATQEKSESTQKQNDDPPPDDPLEYHDWTLRQIEKQQAAQQRTKTFGGKK